MPSAKYYRSVLPLDLLQIIGNYAGDVRYKLVFTLSPKRRFLSYILMRWRDTSMYTTYIQSVLCADSWIPIRLNCIADILGILNKNCQLPDRVVADSLKKITGILLEVHDYGLTRLRNAWLH